MKKMKVSLSLNGFSLIELVIIISVLAILSAVVIPKIGGFITKTKITATKKEMQNLKKAIVGDPNLVSSGSYTFTGYLNDVGALPPALTALVTKPGGVADWDKFTKTGWAGPYIETGEDDSYLADAWGNNYVYDSGAGTLKSLGPDGTNGTGDDIVLQILN